MFRYILSIFSLLFVTSIIAADYPEVTVGIVVPIQHQALNDIVQSFEQELVKEYTGKINFVVKNAQGDINLQRVIIQQFNRDQTDLIVSITTTTTQMVVAIVTKKPIISLAAEFLESQRQQRTVNNITNVYDESGVAVGVEFCFNVMPDLHKITIVHSASDKIMPEVVSFIAAAKVHGIIVQDIMIQQLPELYSASSRIAKDSQAIFILKDNMIASGINTLITIANKKHLPLITSDSATVQSGAALALGVKESQIGIEGAKLAAQVLRGVDISKLPMKTLDKFSVFINENAAKQQGLNLDLIKAAAKAQRYPVVLVGEKI